MRNTNRGLLWAAAATFAGALVHLAMPIGGPAWFAFWHAPEVLVRMAAAGHPHPTVMCVIIAAMLSVCAAYALSGAGVIFRLPLLRIALTAIAAVFVARGLSFIPLIALRPDALADVCDCREVDTFIVLTSALCLALGAGYAAGAARLWRAGRRVS